MLKWESLQLQEFLKLNPKMRLAEFGEESITIAGEYCINAQMEGFKAINDSYQLRIRFPKNYPRSLPTVIDTESRIPRKADYHTYDDGSFCLGSEIKLKSILFKTPSVIDFIDKRPQHNSLWFKYFDKIRNAKFIYHTNRTFYLNFNIRSSYFT